VIVCFQRLLFLYSRKSETFAPMSSMAESKITPAVASSARALRFAAPLDFEDSEPSAHSVSLPVAPTPKNAEIAMPVKSTPLHKQLELQQQQLEQLQQMQLEMQQQLDSNNSHANSNAHEEHAEEIVPRRISKATQQRRASKAAKAAAVIEEEEEREKEAEAKSNISNTRAAAINAAGLVPSNLSASMMVPFLSISILCTSSICAH
jgi:hypothetical protein